MSLLTGLRGYWKLDESAGATRNDSSGNANHLTDHNTVGSSPGKIANAADFVSASSRYLSHADNAAFQMGATTDFTVAFWIKYTAHNQVCFGYGPFGTGNPHYIITTSSSLSANISDGSTQVTTGELHSFDDNAWHFVVMTAARAGNLSLFVDNVLEGTPQSITAVGSLNNSLGLAIGADPSPQLFFDGSIDEVGIWSRVLTSQERSDLWNGGAGFTYPFSTDVTVNLTGVSASPAIGTGTVRIAGGRPSAGFGEPLRPRRLKKIKEPVYALVLPKIEVPQLPPVVRVGLVGTSANSFTGELKINTRVNIQAFNLRSTVIDARAMFNATFQMEPVPVPVIMLGNGAINIIVELSDDEILALIDTT